MARKKKEPLDWHEIWAVARLELGLTEAEIWEITPRMWAALVEQHQAREHRAYWRAALTPWVLASIYSSKGKRPKIEDFIPRPLTAQRRAQTPEDMQRVLISYVAALGGDTRISEN